MERADLWNAMNKRLIGMRLDLTIKAKLQQNCLVNILQTFSCYCKSKKILFSLWTQRQKHCLLNTQRNTNTTSLSFLSTPCSLSPSRFIPLSLTALPLPLPQISLSLSICLSRSLLSFSLRVWLSLSIFLSLYILPTLPPLLHLHLPPSLVPRCTSLL